MEDKGDKKERRRKWGSGPPEVSDMCYQLGHMRG